MIDDLIQIEQHYEELKHKTTEQIVSIAEESVESHGRFTVALAGGSTPQGLYELLTTSEYKSRIPWQNTLIFWGDERCVPSDDPESNYRMAHEALLSHVPVPSDNIFRMAGELEPATAAKQYTEQLHTVFSDQALPVFDLILLGMGTDGHTASLFPDTAALEETEKPVVANYVEKLEAWRLTLTYPVINSARYVLFLVSGESKAQPLKAILNDKAPLPAGLVNPVQGKLHWFIDSDAAALLE